MTVTEAGIREPSWGDVQLWFETIDAIVKGLGHGLNNRALALSATIESLDPKRPVGQQVAGALTREAERLTELLRQLRVLPFTSDREPMPLLLRDVLTGATQLHRAHASVGDVPAYLEGSADTPPVLAPESSLLHAALVTLTALKRFAAPNGVVRISCTGTPDQAAVQFQAMRDPGDSHAPVSASAMVRPTSLAIALLGNGLLEIEQKITPDTATLTWLLPSLKVTRRRSREAAAV